MTAEHGDLEQPEPLALQRAALAYAARGWLVLPLWWPTPSGWCACGLPDCDSVGKHPIPRLAPHGLHDATTRMDTVSAWWRSIPANVGIRTGAASGLVVLDVDGRAGLLALRALVVSHTTFQASWVRTGSGGWHAYFAHPGTPVPSSAGRLGQGLDVRGEGGYVVAPPSLHGSGRCYRWANLQNAGDVPPLPGWLLDLAAPPPPAGSISGQVLLRSDDVDAYAAAALECEAREVAQAPPGRRNHRLNRAAFRVGQLVGAGLLEETAAAAALVAAGLEAGPGERKIRSTVSRGLEAGKRQPRQIVLQADLAAGRQ
jgi:Bifunctional DNA primase/polymerase, N-terminal